MAGGNSGGIESYLPIAAALAATVATDGAASPWLVEAMGATGAAALTSGAAAAAASGLTAAVTGQDVGRSAIMGGVSGGIGGALAGYGAAAGAGTEGVAGASAPLSGANVAGTMAAPQASTAMGELATAPTAAGGFSPYAEALGSNAQTTAGNLGTYWDAIGQSGNAPVLPDSANATLANATGVSAPGGAAATSSGGIGNWLSNNKGIAALGGTVALGALMRQENSKYGTPATQTYDGPLSKFHYDPKKYTPVTTAQPNPAYQAKYANYVKNPYNPYAAEGGKVVSMASGGIANANTGAMPAGGSVEEMSRMNAIGGNQMFPQANISTNAFASPTNRPVSQNIVGSGGAAVDPYTGAERFAEGGATEEKQGLAQVAAPLIAVPGGITQNATAYNNALQQGLMDRMAARQMPAQQMAQAPAQQMAQAPAQQMAQTPAAPYTAPTFTRSTPTPITLNPAYIPGTPAYDALHPVFDDGSGGSGGYRNRGAGGGGDSSDGTGGVGGMGSAGFGGMGEGEGEGEGEGGDGGGDGGSGGDGDAKGGYYSHNQFNYHPKGMASGGIAGHLGGYAAGGNPRLLKGPGDGMSDNIPATIGNKQPARLADGEFVIPADVVSHLGNGSTDAGAKHLYGMMDRVRKARTGNKKQGKQIKPEKFLKA